MGVSLAWIGVKASAADDLYAQLGVSETGASGEFYGFKLAGSKAPGGWHLVTARRCDHPIQSAPVLSALSAGAGIVACAIEEHVMYSSAAYWREGREIWSVQHEGDRDVLHIKVTGMTPENFEDLRARKFAEQAEDDRTRAKGEYGVDYIFDIPLELARTIAGFRHDLDTPGIDHDGFRELRQQAGAGLLSSARPWWKFW